MLQRNGRAHDHDFLGDVAELQSDVDPQFLTDLHVGVRHELLVIRLLHLDAIPARLELGNGEAAFGVGRDRPGFRGGFVDDSHRGLRHRRVRRIGHDSPDRGAMRLGQGGQRGKKYDDRQQQEPERPDGNLEWAWHLDNYTVSVRQS